MKLSSTTEDGDNHTLGGEKTDFRSQFLTGILWAESYKTIIEMFCCHR